MNRDTFRAAAPIAAAPSDEERTHLKTAARWILAVCFPLGLLLAWVPLVPVFPRPGLDPAWAYAMNEAVAHRMQFGRDIIVTFGPYAAVYTRQYNPATDHLMLIGDALVALALAAGSVALAKAVAPIIICSVMAWVCSAEHYAYEPVLARYRMVGRTAQVLLLDAKQPVGVKGPLLVQGWLAVSGQKGIAAESVYVAIVGEDGSARIARTRVVPRPDVNAYFKHPEMGKVGFEALLETTDLEGACKLKFYAVWYDQLFSPALTVEIRNLFQR
ncbi:MAG TPA: hypothetical protein VGD78_21385 [Chthoniobacterales bacterium]